MVRDTDMASSPHQQMPEPIGRPLPGGVTVHYQPAADGFRGPRVPAVVAVDVKVKVSGDADLQLRTPGQVYRYRLVGDHVEAIDERSERLRSAEWVAAAVEVAEVTERAGV